MRLYPDHSIKRKQMLIIMLTSTVSLLLATGAFVIYEFFTYRDTMQSELASQAAFVGENVGVALSFDRPDEAEASLKALRVKQRIVAACIYKDGEIVARYPADGKRQWPEKPEADGYRFEANHLVTFQPILYDGQRIGTIYLQSDLKEMDSRLQQYAGIVGMVMLASLLVSFVLSSRLQRVISEPILSLVQVARQVSEDRNYSVRAVKKSEDELGNLIDGVNEMLSQIQQRDAALQKGREELEQRVVERTGDLLREIAERRRTEEERDRFFTMSLDFLCVAGFDGFFKRINPAFQNVFGYDAQQMATVPFIEIVHPEDREFTMQKVGVLAGGQPTRNVEIRCRGMDGAYRWVSWSANPVLDDGVFYAYGRDFSERKKAEEELAQAHRELLATSRMAGMAEVATSVLHNVGNVLNSVNVSATLVADNLKKSKLASLARVTAMLRENSGNLGRYLGEDPKGRQIPGYLDHLAEHLAAEQASLVKELEQLRRNVEHIKEIVSMQQSYAKVSGVKETVNVVDLVEDTISMNAEAFTRHEVKIEREYTEAIPPLSLDKHKVIQILVNLVRNAKHACEASGKAEKKVTVRITKTEDLVRIAVADNGVGISPDNLVRVFGHGFTTKKDGHGFGLHSGALAAKEMGGALRVHSDGVGCGAVFTLEVPLISVPQT